MRPRAFLRHLLLRLCVLAGATPALAQTPAGEAGLDLTAEQPLEIDGRTREVIARGNARVVFGEWTLTADEIRYNQATGSASASGDVVASRPGLRILAARARYFAETQRVEVEDFRFGRPPYLASGRRGYGDASLMTLEDVEILYGDPGLLTPRAKVRVLRVNREDDLVKAEGFRLSVGAIPLLALSGLVRPLEGPRVVLETRAGFESHLGAQLGAGVYVPTSVGFNPGGSVDVFTSRGVLFGPGVRYDFRRGRTVARGSADLAYIRDSGDRETDVLGRPIDADRHFARLDHVLRHGDEWSLNGELNLWHDSAVVRDFRDELFDRSQDPDNHLEATHRGANHLLSAFTRLRVNDFQTVAERLPEVRLDWLPTPVAATGALFAGHASAAALRERPPGPGGPALRSDRFDVYAALSRTIVPTAGVTITPVAGGRLTHYDRAVGGRDTYTRWLGELGFDARMRAQRTIDLEKPLWGIRGLRHVVEPTVEYRFVPGAKRGREFIPEIDRPAFLTQLQPLGLASRRDIDALEPIHTLRIGLGNLLETRRDDYGSRQVLDARVGLDVFLGRLGSGRDVSDLHLDVRLTPADWFEGWLFVRLDPEETRLEEFNARATLVDGAAWSVGVGVDYLRDDIEQGRLHGRYALDEVNELYAGIRYDFREGRFNEIGFGVNSRISQLWVAGAGVRFRDGQLRESDFGIRLTLGFVGF